ncbi:hypothetical protein GON03_16985 [Nocardioides sp. MAH-18]|uniref:HTH luxR-type domain-containing protein n=1 Tax=Nocardioides agri TaxID=2682843 RepID=A0A6L6XVX9_9ACTN|nr:MULTISPECIES: hypothetical protein [unclassified Nocardioides]MBA2956036.1 hypothetical protein [Nocardioides sp. CGMCC 1.13656]MVQ50883.1 hypothetical protein [Nocardioides sp. MAH-18]
MSSDAAASAAAAYQALRVGLRSRASTVAELAALAVRDQDEVRRDLEWLDSEGFLELRGDKITYSAPEEVVADVVRRRAGDLGAEMLRHLADLAEVVGHLPALAREWDTGGSDQQLLDVEVFHGPEAVVDLWHVRQGRKPAQRTDVVLPDASRLYIADPAMQEVWHEAGRGEGHRIRVIASIADAVHPEAQQRVSEELEGGLQLRMLERPPGWFWVTDEDTVALPLTWGETWPTSVIAVRSRAVAGMASWLFERLWERGIQARSQDAAWDPLLTLMDGGATLESAARALGISERTGRRRVSEAMDHFGVGSMFELGVAWGGARPS